MKLTAMVGNKPEVGQTVGVCFRFTGVRGDLGRSGIITVDEVKEKPGGWPGVPNRWLVSGEVGNDLTGGAVKWETAHAAMVAAKPDHIALDNSDRFWQ